MTQVKNLIPQCWTLICLMEIWNYLYKAVTHFAQATNPVKLYPIVQNWEDLVNFDLLQMNWASKQ